MRLRDRLYNLAQNDWWVMIFICVMAFVVRILFFSWPPQIVFDEVYFINYASDYFTGSYYFDPHPPLGKLLIAGLGYLTGFTGNVQFTTIGEAFPNGSYLVLRLLPMVFGSLLPGVIYFLARRLSLSRVAAFFVAMILVIESTFIIQSRFVLLDNSMLLFGFLSLLFYFKSRGEIRLQRYMLLAGVFGALAFSIKWTGAAFLGIIGVCELIDLIRKNYGIKMFLRYVLYYAIIPFILYFAQFYIHFKLLPNPGQGDPFMTQNFQQLSVFDKFTEINSTMLSLNAHFEATHDYATKWYTWPFMKRGIFYWQGGEGEMIYLLGNPFVYLATSLAMLWLIVFLIRQRFKNKIALFLLFGYLANLLPFAVIHRPMFLYHYLSALVFAIMTLGFLIDQHKDEHAKKCTFIALFVVAFLTFIYFSPILYGIHTPGVFERFWFSSWR
jgi:dolichyl-phosphate-mannose-protein mannosyltransferase